MVDAQERALLEKRHRYSEWRNRSRLDSTLVLHGFSFSGDELEGWTVARSGVKASAVTRHLQSLWRPLQGSSEELLDIEVFECASLDAAHEYMIQALGELQSTEITLRPDLDIGDVAFGSVRTLLFARANL